MKKYLLLILFFSSFLFAQEDAWVYFNDKPNAQQYLDNPLMMLSQRALDRRAAQGIALEENDAPIEQSYIDQVAASSGIEIKAKSKWLNCLHIRGVIADIQALTNFSFVNHIYFADNSLNAKNFHPINNKPLNKNLNVQATFNYGNSSNQIQMINAQYLHENNNTGSGKIIAVLDGGFTAVNTIIPFNRMFNHNLYLGGYNYVAGNNDIFSTHFHGTMTLSCMAAYVDGQLIGTAPDAQYYLYITEDVTSENPVEESYWVEAAEEADKQGVDIISTSLGYFTYDNPNYSHTYSEMTGYSAFASQGANIAFSKGIIVVASAGNSGGSTNPYIGVPAEATNVLAVGAVQYDRTYANFSSIGPSFDGRIKPDVMAKGLDATVSDTLGSIITASGTSFSCPIIAGAIASFWSAFPNLTNQQVIDFVKQSSDRYSSPNNEYGYGIPDFQLAYNSVLLSTNNNVKNNFLIYPNPFKENISVSCSMELKNYKFILMNSLGQIVMEKTIMNSFENDLFLNNLSKGIYFYKIEGNSILQTGKLIKE